MENNIPFKLKFYHRARKAQLIRGGKAFFDILEQLISEARFEIHLQFYILEDDETGRRIINALKDASLSGVSVYLVLDAFGSGKLDKSVLKEFEDTGINFKWFRPVIAINNMEFGRRLHHKILSVDERVALTTGVNIANRYNDINGIPAWLDFALLVEGITAREIKRRALQIWEKNFEIMKRFRRFRLPVITDSIQADNPLVKVSVNDWLRGRNGILVGYRHAINVAQKEIFIAGGYFLPGRNLRKVFRNARQRGVSISVILTKFSDVTFAKEASEYLYSWMFKWGIKIYEWEPNIMHGKVAVVDRLWSTVGSFNMNYLSAFESIELNMEIIEEGFSSQLHELLDKISRSECEEVTEAEFTKHLSLKKRIRNWIAFVFIRYSFRILNLFSKKPKTLYNGEN